MKRDLDLLRELLIEIEDRGPGSHKGMTFQRKDRTDLDIAWHLSLLADAKFVIARADPPADPREPIAAPNLGRMIIHRITHEGCEYLDSIREPRRWAQIKKKIEEEVESAPIEIVKALAVSAIRNVVGI